MSPAGGGSQPVVQVRSLVLALSIGLVVVIQSELQQSLDDTFARFHRRQDSQFTISALPRFVTVGRGEGRDFFLVWRR